MRQLLLLLICAAGLWAGSTTTANSNVTTTTWHVGHGCHGSNYPYACSSYDVVDSTTIHAEHSEYWDNGEGTYGYFVDSSQMTFDARTAVPAGGTLVGASLRLNVTDYRNDNGCAIKLTTGGGWSTPMPSSTGVATITLQASDISLSGLTYYNIEVGSYDDGCRPGADQYNYITVDGKPQANKPYLILTYWAAPSFVSMTGFPARYSVGVQYTVTVTWTDPAGGADVDYMGVGFTNYCSVNVNPSQVSVYDNGTTWYSNFSGGPARSTTYCDFDATGGSFTVSGDNRTATFKVTPKSPMASSFNLTTGISYGYGGSRPAPNGGGFYYSPTITIQAETRNNTPVTVSQSGLPANFNIGTEQTLVSTIRDADGYGDIQYGLILYSYGVDGTNACYFLFYPNSNAIYLMNDAGDNWGGGATFGAATTLSNSSCKLNAQTSSRSISGTDATATLKVTFLPLVFNRGGGRTPAVTNSYLYLIDNSNAGTAWVNYQAATARTGPRLFVTSQR